MTFKQNKENFLPVPLISYLFYLEAFSSAVRNGSFIFFIFLSSSNYSFPTLFHKYLRKNNKDKSNIEFSHFTYHEISFINHAGSLFFLLWVLELNL